MTLPASGAISLYQICDEFGLPHTSVFPTAFYGKGGAPASGALSFADFYGRTNGPAAHLTNRTVSDSAFNAGSASAVYHLNATGTVTDQDGTLLETWLVSGTAAEVQVRATLLSGAVTGGDGFGTWLACSTSRDWFVNASGGEGTNSASIKVELRNASTLALLATATINLSANSVGLG